MNKFNLIDELWIPCLMTEGNEIREFGLKDVLREAPKIKEIVDNSPFVAVSLHRLLLAILHRNFGPKTFGDWKDIWRKGKWDEQILDAYFAQWKKSFNLFDDERPFYQYPTVNKKGGKEADIASLSLLMQEQASGNNATLFDHSSKAIPREYSPAIAARYLVARQAFSFGGGVSAPFNLAHSTMISGFSVLANGKNLFETLTLNLVIYDSENDKPIVSEGGGKDVPFWEREELTQSTIEEKDGTAPLGYLDYLTWQSRRIKLISDNDFESVTGCQLQQNYKLDEGDRFFEPFKVYMSGKDDGFYALNLNPNKSLWRNSHAIFNQQIRPNQLGGLFDHLAQIHSAVRDNEIDGDREYSLSVYGVINDKANVLVWNQERLPLPLDFLNNIDLLESLRESIEFAEKFGQILRGSLKTLGTELIDKKSQIAKSFPGVPFYWSSLENGFNKLLLGLPENDEEAMGEWVRLVNQTAREGFRKTADSLSGSALEQKAIVKSERLFYGLIQKYLKGSDYEKYFPKQKSKGGGEV